MLNTSYLLALTSQEKYSKVERTKNLIDKTDFFYVEQVVFIEPIKHGKVKLQELVSKLTTGRILHTNFLFLMNVLCGIIPSIFASKIAEARG